MIRLDEISKATVTRAIERAKAEKPLIQPLMTGMFLVRSSNKEDFYTVEFASIHAAKCQCAAHTKSTSPKLCFHITAAYPLYQKQLADIEAKADELYA